MSSKALKLVLYFVFLKKLKTFIQRIIFDKNNSIEYLIIFLYGLLAILLLRFHPYLMANTETDAVDYLQRAENLWEINVWHGPGYSWTIAFLQLFKIKGVIAGKIISSISGLSILFLFRKIIRKLNIPYPSLCLGLVAFNVTFLVESVMCLSDMLGSALLLWVLYLLIYSNTPQLKTYIFCGAIIAYGYLVRSVVLYPATIAIIASLLFASSLSFIKRGFFFIIYIATFLIVTGPWLIHVNNKYGAPFYNKNHLTISFSAYHDQDWTKPITIKEYPDMKSVLLKDPARLFRFYTRSLIHMPDNVNKVFPIFGYFFLFGLLVYITRLNSLSFILFSGLGTYALLLGLLYFKERFWIPLIPIISIFTTLAVNQLPKAINFKKTSYAFRFPIILCLLMLLIYETKHAMKFRFSDRPPEWSQAYKALNKIPSGSHSVTIAAAKPHFAYFSSQNFLPLAELKPKTYKVSDIINALISKQADYLVIENRAFNRNFKNMKHLLELSDKNLPQELSIYHSTSKPAIVKIYKINHENNQLGMNSWN